jgi:hypothetical protein
MKLYSRHLRGVGRHTLGARRGLAREQREFTSRCDAHRGTAREARRAHGGYINLTILDDSH